MFGGLGCGTQSRASGSEPSTIVSWGFGFRVDPGFVDALPIAKPSAAVSARVEAAGSPQPFLGGSC